MPTLNLYSRILRQFPHEHIKFAFAYGSGVFDQTNNVDQAKNMIDFMFVVDDDATKFHEANLKQNSSHYSFLKYGGPYYVSRFQNDFGASCYFNTLVKLRLEKEKNEKEENVTRLIKYGVITEKALIKDLFDWEWLYVSGRLQKPVKIIKKETPTISSATTKMEPKDNGQSEDEENGSLYNFAAVNQSLDVALQCNLRNALHTSLLLMPERFSLQALFNCVTALSYTGDLRMIVGENKNKCANIVRPQMERFTHIYKPYIAKECIEGFLACDFATGQLEQRLNPPTLYRHLSQLPRRLIQTIVANRRIKSAHYLDMEETIYKLTNRIDVNEIVTESVEQIVRGTSTSQSVKGAFTAGFFKAIDYSLRKLNKMIKK